MQFETSVVFLLNAEIIAFSKCYKSKIKKKTLPETELFKQAFQGPSECISRSGLRCQVSKSYLIL